MLQGHFLIAVPQLHDPNFSRTVVLMVQHDEQGALGVVLNRPSGRSVQEVWAESIDRAVDCNQPLLIGGPVPGPVMALHDTAALSEAEILPGVFFSTERDHLEQLVDEDRLPLMIFSGYSGWASGQLEAELEAGGWITRAATKEDIFADEADLWQKIGRDITDQVLRDALQIKHVPHDPSMN